MRRALVILVAFTGETGHTHPHLALFFANYRTLFGSMSISGDQIAERLAEIAKEAGLETEEFGKILERVSGGES